MRKTLLSAISVFALAAGPALAASDTKLELDTQGGVSVQGGSAQGGSAAETQIETDASTAAEVAAGGDVIAVQAENQVLSETYIGAPVMTGRGENAETIGDVSALIFDDNRNLVGVVVGVGGFLGVGEKPVAVRWEALQEYRENGETQFVTSLSREVLEQAPTFKTLAEARAEAEAEADISTGERVPDVPLETNQ